MDTWGAAEASALLLEVSLHGRLPWVRWWLPVRTSIPNAHPCQRTELSQSLTGAFPWKSQILYLPTPESTITVSSWSRTQGRVPFYHTDMRLRELWGPAGQVQHSRADYLLEGRKDQLNKTLRNSCTPGHTCKYSPTLHVCQLREDDWRRWADGGKQPLPRPLQPAGNRGGASTAPSGRASELHSQLQARRESRHLVLSRSGQVAKGTVEDILGKEDAMSTGPVWAGISTLEETMPCSVSTPWPVDKTPLKS